MPKDTVSTASNDPNADGGYEPPQNPTDDHPGWLATKIAVAAFLADFIASTLIGFPSPTWSIILATYLACQPPESGAASAGRKLLAMMVGVVLGVAGAWANQFVPNGASAATFLVIGIVGGTLAARSADYVFAAVVATVITFSAQSGEELVIVEALQAAIMIVVGCIVGPTVVFLVERFRAWRHGRS